MGNISRTISAEETSHFDLWRSEHRFGHAHPFSVVSFGLFSITDLLVILEDIPRLYLSFL
jgi:hypothetical protein